MKSNPNWHEDPLKEAEEFLSGKYEKIEARHLVKKAGVLYATYNCSASQKVEEVVIRITNQGRYASVKIWSVSLIQLFNSEYSEDFW